MNVVLDGIIETLQSNGGITVYFRELLEGLAATNSISVDYLSYESQGLISQSDAASRVKVVPLKARIIERYRTAECARPQGAIFHSSYYRLPEKRLAAKVVTTVHDFTYEKFRQGIARYLHSEQKYAAISRSDAVICISQNTAVDLQRYCPVRPEKIHVIYNGVSDRYMPLDSLPKDSSQTILFVGARSGYKNFALAVQSLAKLPDYRLSIIGGGALNAKEKALLALYLEGRYKHYMYLTDAELNLQYNSAHCLLYLSSYEGFGIPVIEAMRTGCPVVAMNSSSIPEISGRSALLLDREDLGDVREAIIQLEGSHLRSSLIARGLLNTKRFSWKKTSDELINLYRQL